MGENGQSGHNPRLIDWLQSHCDCVSNSSLIKFTTMSNDMITRGLLVPSIWLDTMPLYTCWVSGGTCRNSATNIWSLVWTFKVNQRFLVSLGTSSRMNRHKLQLGPTFWISFTTSGIFIIAHGTDLNSKSYLGVGTSTDKKVRSRPAHCCKLKLTESINLPHAMCLSPLYLHSFPFNTGMAPSSQHQ